MSSSPFTHPSRPRSPQRPLRPQLVPRSRPRYSALSLWHLLSLDAPTVATLWTVFIARCSHLHLPWTEPAAMFLAVWMIYAADRLLDARLADTPPLESRLSPTDLETRHRFHHAHRTAFLAFIVFSSIALAVLLHRIDSGALHLYALLATLLAAWMLLIHIRPAPNGPTGRLPKELAVGIFFPAAVFIPTLVRTTPTAAAIHFIGSAANWIRPSLLPSALLFAAVCTLNCLCLYAWEHPTPRNQELSTDDPPPTAEIPHQQAHWTTRWATSHLTTIALVILAASTIASVSRALPIALPALACSLSTAALFALNLYRRRLSPIHLRATADLVLLTPILFLPFVR
ncbi:hypothetical protein [Granulicella sp. L46]|uniref:hypothetical protein n=1 Tax=Granulicella sp. L46 TaxID=1641865 RepID=UPI00131AF28B|nr:hypothetical protein [Granulicella sp. L46]